jgi:type VI secretion system protein
MGSSSARFVILAASTLLSACALVPGFLRGNPPVTLRVSVASDANRDTPIPVDVVYVWDEKLVEALSEMPAKTWFEQKRQLRNGDPYERAFGVQGWEWVPGQAVTPQECRAKKRPRAVFLFANYRNEGPHRFRLQPGSAASLALMREEATLQPFSRRRFLR